MKAFGPNPKMKTLASILILSQAQRAIMSTEQDKHKTMFGMLDEMVGDLESMYSNPHDFSIVAEVGANLSDNLVDPFKEFMDSLYTKTGNRRISGFMRPSLEFMVPEQGETYEETVKRRDQMLQTMAMTREALHHLALLPNPHDEVNTVFPQALQYTLSDFANPAIVPG